MKAITENMIKKWNMTNIDWMGYYTNKYDYTFHHLIIPNRDGGPYAEWNGAILNGKTGHPYLHQVERYDYERFLYITSLLIDENILQKLDLKTLKEIDEVLKQYEREWQGYSNKKGKRLIKPEYTIRDYKSYFR